MALKRLDNVAETAPASSSKDEKPVVKVSGRVIARFIEATALLKAQKAIQDEERTKLLKRGLEALFIHNCAHPDNPATSITLLQENKVEKDVEPVDGDGETVRLSFQNRYSPCDADTADRLFEDLLKPANAGKPRKEQLSINNFMQETATANFDSTVFLAGPDGAFSQQVFRAYLGAITKVTEDLVRLKLLPEGTKVPLAVAKKVLPLATFHEQRWEKFPNATAQEQLFEVVSNTVTLTPTAKSA